MLLAPSVPEIQSIDFNASLHPDSVALNLNFPFQCAKIIGSCRGLLLFDCNPNLYLWNPSTGIHKRIPSSPMESNLDAMTYTFLYGFGYDPSTDDYLVVQAYNDLSAVEVVTHVELFSFRANMWKQMEGTHLSYTSAVDDPEGDKFGLLLNGAIHWLAFSADQSVNVIFAFDLTERSFSEIPLPVDFQSDFINDGDLWVIGGFLSLWDLDLKGHTIVIDIWIMEEYKVQSSWTKTIVVSYDGIPTRYFSPICTSKSGDIVGTDGGTGLVKCDDRGQLLKYCTFGGDVHGCMYTQSLLPLPGVSQQAEEDD